MTGVAVAGPRVNPLWALQRIKKRTWNCGTQPATQTNKFSQQKRNQGPEAHLQWSGCRGKRSIARTREREKVKQLWMRSPADHRPPTGTAASAERKGPRAALVKSGRAGGRKRDRPSLANGASRGPAEDLGRAHDAGLLLGRSSRWATRAGRNVADPHWLNGRVQVRHLRTRQRTSLAADSRYFRWRYFHSSSCDRTVSSLRFDSNMKTRPECVLNHLDGGRRGDLFTGPPGGKQAPSTHTRRRQRRLCGDSGRPVTQGAQ